MADGGPTIEDIHHLIKSGNLAEAQALCGQLRAINPQDWKVERAAVRIALVMGDMSFAESSIMQAKTKGAPQLELGKMTLRLARKVGDNERAITALRALEALEPENQQWLKSQFKLFCELLQTREAFAVLERLLRIAPDFEVSFSSLRSLLDNGLKEDLLRGIELCLHTAPKQHALLAVRALHRFRVQETRAALSDFEAVFSHAPQWNVPAVLQKFILSNIGQSGDGVAWIEQLQKAYPANKSLLWLAAKVLDLTGDLNQAKELIGKNWSWVSQSDVPPWALALMAKDADPGTIPKSVKAPSTFSALLMRNRLDEARDIAQHPEQSSVISDLQLYPETPDTEICTFGESGDVIIYGKHRSGGVVLSFGGLGGRTGLPTHLLDRLFSVLDLSLIQLLDHSRMVYLNGVRGLGASLDETVSSLQNLISTFPGKEKVFTVGHSGGTMAAICYAEALMAQAALVFSPFATIDRDRYQEKMGDQRASIVLRRLTKNLDINRFDLEKILARTPNEFRVHSYVNVEDPVLSAHGKMLSKMPRVSTTYLDGDVNSPLLLAAHQIGLMDVFRNAFATSE